MLTETARWMSVPVEPIEPFFNMAQRMCLEGTADTLEKCEGTHVPAHRRFVQIEELINDIYTPDPKPFSKSQRSPHFIPSSAASSHPPSKIRFPLCLKPQQHHGRHDRFTSSFPYANTPGTILRLLRKHELCHQLTAST